VTPRRAILLPLAALLLALASCSNLEPPAAVVNGVKIPNADVAADTKLFEAIAGITRQSCGQQEPGDTVDAACARAVLGTRIQEAIVISYANAHAITVDPAKVTESENNLKSQLGGKTADQALAEQGVSEAEFVQFARRVTLFSDVQQAIAASAVDEAALRQLYEQNIAQYEDIHAEHILVKTKAEAERVYAEVTAPGATRKTFEDLAKKVSTDTGSASKGGDLGIQTAAALTPPFANAALALEPGEISKPVHTSFGWHVIRLISKDVKPFNVVRPTLAQQQTGSAFEDWLKKQVSEATILVNPRYGRWDATLQTVVAIRSTATGTPTAAPSPTASPAVSP